MYGKSPVLAALAQQRADIIAKRIILVWMASGLLGVRLILKYHMRRGITRTDFEELIDLLQSLLPRHLSTQLT